MTILILCTWLVVWSLTMPRRPARTALTTTLTSPDQSTARVAPAAGLEDDPARWPKAAVGGDWTELDERQLIRLLTNPPSGPHQSPP